MLARGHGDHNCAHTMHPPSYARLDATDARLEASSAVDLLRGVLVDWRQTLRVLTHGAASAFCQRPATTNHNGLARSSELPQSRAGPIGLVNRWPLPPALCVASQLDGASRRSLAWRGLLLRGCYRRRTRQGTSPSRTTVQRRKGNLLEPIGQLLRPTGRWGQHGDARDCGVLKPPMRFQQRGARRLQHVVQGVRGRPQPRHADIGRKALLTYLVGVQVHVATRHSAKCCGNWSDAGLASTSAS